MPSPRRLLSATALLFCLSSPAQAQCPTEDFTQFVQGREQCMVMRRWGDESPEVMLVWLHGDVSDGGPGNYHFGQAERAGRELEGRRVMSVALVRPGYPDGAGNTSGVNWLHAGRFDHHTRVNIGEVGAAIARLRERYAPRQVIAVGHSGGAATAAVLLGLHPGLLDAAVLVACPCAASWRDGRRPWPRSENAAHWADKIPQGSRVVAITGSLDDNTTPQQAESYVAALSARGVRAEFRMLQGQTHNGAFRGPQVMEAVRGVMGE